MWMYHRSKSKDDDECICGTDHHNEIIRSSMHKEFLIIYGLAMTFDIEPQIVVAGYPLFGWIHKPLASRDKVYRKVPLNKSLLNDTMHV